MSNRRPHLDALAIASLIGCAALWGVNQSAAKFALHEMPPLGQAALRSLGAALLLALWARWRGTPLGLAAPTWRAGLLAGGLFALEFGGIFIGLQHTTASRMVVYIYLAPFFVALGMPFIAPGERLRPLQLGGLVLAFAGVLLAFAEGFTAPAAGPLQWLGDALGVAGAALWAATTLTIRASSLANAPAERTLMYQLLISGLGLGTAALLVGEPWPALGQISGLAWGALFFQTAIVTFASYLLWFWLMAHYPATQMSAYTLLTPVFGLIAGVVLLHEPLTVRLCVALGTVVAGLAMMNRGKG